MHRHSQYARNKESDSYRHRRRSFDRSERDAGSFPTSSSRSEDIRQISVQSRSRSRLSEVRDTKLETPSETELIGDSGDDGTLYFSDCVMLPPREGIDLPARNKTPKPGGCKTLFIGGLPEPLARIPKRLENILTEVFTANGGEIDAVRISGRGFCHIRFKKQESVDIAMLVSGYYMEVKQGYEDPLRFRLLLDYSESQADAEDYEAKKIIAKRLCLENDNVPTIPMFNSAAVESLGTDLKNPESYFDSVVILRYWMDSHLNRQTSVRFFNMLQVSSTQIRRLQNEKKQLDDECKAMMSRYRSNHERLDKEIDHLIRLYEDTHKQKLWDNFTKPQRKSIDTWLENARDSVSKYSKDVDKNEPDPDMNSFGLDNHKNPKQTDQDKTNQISTLKQSLQYMQHQVWEMVAKLQTKDGELRAKQNELEQFVAQNEEHSMPTKRKRKDDGDNSIDLAIAKMICALTAFLQVYPNGATTECIEKYLTEECNIIVKRDDMESKLFQLNDIFSKQMTVEDGKTIMKWKYVMLKEK